MTDFVYIHSHNILTKMALKTTHYLVTDLSSEVNLLLTERKENYQRFIKTSLYI